MRNRKEIKSGLFLVHFSSGKEGEDDLRELVHHGDHRLPMAEPLIPLLVVIGTEEGGIDDGFLGHDVDILPEAPVPVFCYMALAEAFAGLVDGRVRTHVGDELLVGCEPGDVLDFRHEVCSGYLSDTRNRCQDFQLLPMYFLLMLHEGLCKCLVAVLQEEDLLCAVLHEVGVSGNSDAAYGIALDVLHGDGEVAPPVEDEGIGKIHVISGKDLVRRCEPGEEGEHGGCKHIHRKDFRPCDGEVALELGLGPGYVLGDLLPPPCYAPHLVIHDALLLMEPIVIGEAVSCNAQGVGAVGLRPAQRRGPDVVLDHHRILDAHLAAILAEEVAEVPVVASCGFHNKDGVFWNMGKKAVKAIIAHFTAAFGKACSILVDDTVVELPACDVDAGDVAHGFTSWVMKDGSPHPISRVNEALTLNQPIGIERELGQTPVEALGLGDMSSSVPSIISFMTPCYGIYC